MSSSSNSWSLIIFTHMEVNMLHGAVTSGCTARALLKGFGPMELVGLKPNCLSVHLASWLKAYICPTRRFSFGARVPVWLGAS